MARMYVVNCSQISIFASRTTTKHDTPTTSGVLWIALKLVSLRRERQRFNSFYWIRFVVNCSQISIFASRTTTTSSVPPCSTLLWIALKLVSLRRERQRHLYRSQSRCVVNCSQISIFASRTTTGHLPNVWAGLLWIALKLVSLRRERQPRILRVSESNALWIALKLVSLRRERQPSSTTQCPQRGCELLSN